MTLKYWQDVITDRIWWRGFRAGALVGVAAGLLFAIVALLAQHWR
jgi:tetrahydromethanopterin S-methyltransferase subunit F